MSKAAAAPEEGIRLSAHPRARRHIAMAKGWGGLGAFVLVVWLSRRAGVPMGDALLRGVLGGFAGYLVCWMVAVTVWRQIALAEIERVRQRVISRMNEQAEQIRAAAAAASRGGGRPPDAGGTA